MQGSARWILVLLCAWASAASASQETGSAAAFAQEVALIQREAGDRSLILLGEMHGTREIPRLVAELVVAYADDGPLLLGLEIPRSEHAALSRYMRSDGGPAARAALLATPFWSVAGSQHDGRRSHDMVELVDRVRQLRAGGADVAILAYDAAPFDPDELPRDQRMADTVRAANAALPNGRMLVLSGNVHAMLRRPSYAPPEMQVPMGVWLRDLDPYAVEISAADGEFWGCRGVCGPRRIAAGIGRSGPTGGPSGEDPYHLRAVLPRFTVARLLGAEHPR